MSPRSLKTWISGVLCALTSLLVYSFIAEHRLLAQNNIIYVNDDASGSNDGSSWANAYTKLQDALVAATPGKEIWVAAGVYYPDEGGGTVNDDIGVSFALKSGVALYGGFAGTETELSQRDFATNFTVLSSDIGQDDLTDANHIVTNALDIIGTNAFHAVLASYVDSSARLDGFVLTAGLANQDPAYCPAGCGGALFAVEGSPTLANLTVIGNRATYGGGMIFRGPSSPTLTDSTFTANYSEKFAGGLQTQEGAEITVTRVKFINNSASELGGGFRIVSVDATLNDVTFEGNGSNDDGGGLHITGGKVTINKALFDKNSTRNDGGGIYADGGSLEIQNARFEKNSNISGNGGGIYSKNTTLDIQQSDFVGNNGRDDGGAIASLQNNAEITVTLTDVTMTANQTQSAEGSGGALVQEGGKLNALRVMVRNNIGQYLGGGMSLYNLDAILTNVQFLGNFAADLNSDTPSSGGGIYMYMGNLTASNLIMSGNYGSLVGAIYLQNVTAQLYNATLAENAVSDLSFPMQLTEGIRLDNSDIIVNNSILWDSSGNTMIAAGNGSGITHRYSLFNGSDQPQDPEGYIDTKISPFRADPTPGDDGFGNDPTTEEDESANDIYGDLRLNSTTPAIDAGSNSHIPTDLLDVDGDDDVAEELPLDILGAPRKVRFVAAEPRVDMGAYEYQNAAPTVVMAGPFTLDEGGSIELDATGSTDDSIIVSYAWDCTNNGSTDVIETSPSAGACAYADDGIYTLRLTVSDNFNATSTATTTVTVANVAPTYTPANNQSAVAGNVQSINLGSFIDPGAEGIWNVSVNWGGETTEFTTDETGTLPAKSHTFASAGTFNVVVTLDDGEDDDTSSFQVVVNSPPPGAPVVTAPATGQEASAGVEQLFSLGSFADAGSSGPWTVTVRWGDDSADTTFVMSSSGQLSAQPHTYAAPGDYEVLVSVSDGALNTTMTFSVTIRQQPQEAKDALLLPFTRK